MEEVLEEYLIIIGILFSIVLYNNFYYLLNRLTNEKLAILDFSRDNPCMIYLFMSKSRSST